MKRRFGAWDPGPRWTSGYATNHGVTLSFEEIKASLKDNPLLTSQMEALNAPFELVWRLGTLNFTDGSLTRSSERTGGQRFQKVIKFSSNLDLLGILEETDPNGFARVLLNWLMGATFHTIIILKTD